MPFSLLRTDGVPVESLRPGVRMIDKLTKRGPAVGKMDQEALAQAQATVFPESGMISVILGRAPRSVTISKSSFIASHGQPLPLRIYTPRSVGHDRPVVVSYHGGGFALGSARQTDWMSGYVCKALDAVVFSVDYRLAPTHPFPAAVEDCYETLTWVAEHAGEFGGDPKWLAVMGESAGGNLSAVMAIMSRDRGGPAIAQQTLLYPVTDLTDAIKETASYQNHRGIVLSNEDMDVFNQYYMPDGVDRSDWRLSPIYAKDLSGLPPAVVVVGGLDPLHDLGVSYAKALASAGVSVTLEDYPQMPHGFLNFPYLSKSARPAMKAVVTSMRQTR